MFSYLKNQKETLPRLVQRSFGFTKLAVRNMSDEGN